MNMRDKFEKLKSLWSTQSERVFAESPFHGVYCVYSMYWRQVDEPKEVKNRAKADDHPC